MAKINITITKIENGFLRTNEEIVNIDICNGNWKYWDNLQETDEKTSLTINNLYDATYLQMPVKDAIAHHDQKEWKENRKLIITDATLRTYDTLLGYLNCRINNFKEWNKKYGDTEQTTTAILFKEVYVKSYKDEATRNVEYKVDGLITVKITLVE